MTEKAYGVALKMLGRRDHFSAELTTKLDQRGFASDEVEQAMERCRGAGLIDDRKLAARFVELRARGRGWGPRRLRAELVKRGLSSAIASEVVADREEIESAAMATALRRVEARRPDGWWRLPALRSRMISSLVSRGFEVESASAAVANLAAQREKFNHEDHDHSGDPLDLP